MAEEEKKEKKKKSKKKAEEPAAAPAEAESAPPKEEETAAVSEAPAEAPAAASEQEEAPAAPAPAAPAVQRIPAKASTKRKIQRSGSNIFAMFTQHQVQEFKEAFQLIDQDKDGFITKNDLRATFESLGRIVDDASLESMVGEAPGPINFTMFLTIFGERIAGADDEDVIISAFSWFDEGEGKMRLKDLQNALMKRGDRLTEEEVEMAFSEAPVERGFIDIKRFTTILVRGEDDEYD